MDYLNNIDDIDLVGMTFFEKKVSPLGYVVKQQIQLDDKTMDLICQCNIIPNLYITICFPEEIYKYQIVDPIDDKLKFFDEYIYNLEIKDKQKRQEELMERTLDCWEF
jgi:hypothetical protein